MLIVVAGLATVLATLCIAFLTRMREDVAMSAEVLREAQARIMLVAACSYLQEASRLGWDRMDGGDREEAFGWVDVRDGRLGPKPDAAGIDDDSRFPIGRVARFPMHVPSRTPYATRLTACYNPIVRDPTAADHLMPYLRELDPQPVADTWEAFAAGDPRPVASSTGRSWFRVLREGPARFLVTCGAGASEGFRDWDEVVAAGAAERFGGLPSTFALVRAGERRLWYRLEVSPTGADSQFRNIETNGIVADSYLTVPMNKSRTPWPQMKNRNLVGTIRWVQRVADEPATY